MIVEATLTRREVEDLAEAEARRVLDLGDLRLTIARWDEESGLVVRFEPQKREEQES